jgi:hypothetical protein
MLMAVMHLRIQIHVQVAIVAAVAVDVAVANHKPKVLKALMVKMMTARVLKLIAKAQKAELIVADVVVAQPVKALLLGKLLMKMA